MKEWSTWQSRCIANSWKNTSTATGEAVDHSIMATHYSWCSCKRMKLQGFRTSAKGKYSILHQCYYSAMQQISDKWLWWSSMSTFNWFHLQSDLCDQCSDTMFMYFPSSLTLSWSEELRSWDWIKCYTISLIEIRNQFRKQYQADLQHLQMEWSDWCYWAVRVVTSLVQFVLHELHPDDIVTFKVIHGEYTIKENTCFQLKPNVIVSVYYSCVHWDWGRQ